MHEIVGHCNVKKREDTRRKGRDHGVDENSRYIYIVRKIIDVDII